MPTLEPLCLARWSMFLDRKNLQDNTVKHTAILLDPYHIVSVAESRITLIQKAMLASAQNLEGFCYRLRSILIVVIAGHRCPRNPKTVNQSRQLLVRFVIPRPSQIAADGNQVGLHGIDQTSDNILKQTPPHPVPPATPHRLAEDR